MTVNWDKVRRRREELNMTMDDLGRAIGVQRSAINKYEKGKIKNVSIMTIDALSKALGVSPGYLMDLEPQEDPEPPKRMYAQVAAPKTQNVIDLDQYEKASVGEQIKSILNVWEKTRPDARRMVTPILIELNEMEGKK